MKLSAPKQLTWIIALILAICAVICKFAVASAAAAAFWLALCSAVLLLVATFLAGI